MKRSFSRSASSNTVYGLVAVILVVFTSIIVNNYLVILFAALVGVSSIFVALCAKTMAKSKLQTNPDLLYQGIITTFLPIFLSLVVADVVVNGSSLFGFMMASVISLSLSYVAYTAASLALDKTSSVVFHFAFAASAALAFTSLYVWVSYT